MQRSFITASADVAKGSFYTYFKRKEDVISEIALDKYEDVKELSLKSNKGVCNQLTYYLEKSAEIIEAGSLQMAQQWMKSVTAPLDAETAGIRKYQFDKENIVGILMKAVEAGELDTAAPVEIISKNIMNTYYGAVATWCINKGEDGTLMESIQLFCEYQLVCVIEKYKSTMS